MLLKTLMRSPPVVCSVHIGSPWRVSLRVTAMTFTSVSNCILRSALAGRGKPSLLRRQPRFQGRPLFADDAVIVAIVHAWIGRVPPVDRLCVVIGWAHGQHPRADSNTSLSGSFLAAGSILKWTQSAPGFIPASIAGLMAGVIIAMLLRWHRVASVGSVCVRSLQCGSARDSRRLESAARKVGSHFRTFW